MQYLSLLPLALRRAAGAAARARASALALVPPSVRWRASARRWRARAAARRWPTTRRVLQESRVAIPVPVTTASLVTVPASRVSSRVSTPRWR